MEVIIIASHGELAKGMKSTIKMISGLDDNVVAFCMLDGMTPNTIMSEVESFVNSNEKYTKFIMFSDLLGGSVNTSLIKLLDKEDFYLVSGMNLPLILEIALSMEEDIDKRIDHALEVAKESMKNVKIQKYVEEDIWEV